MSALSRGTAMKVVPCALFSRQPLQSSPSSSVSTCFATQDCRVKHCCIYRFTTVCLRRRSSPSSNLHVGTRLRMIIRTHSASWTGDRLGSLRELNGHVLRANAADLQQKRRNYRLAQQTISFCVRPLCFCHNFSLPCAFNIIMRLPCGRTMTTRLACSHSMRKTTYSEILLLQSSRLIVKVTSQQQD